MSALDPLRTLAVILGIVDREKCACTGTQRAACLAWTRVEFVMLRLMWPEVSFE